MENDPNKNESKGKRILKKALRRNSKSNNNNNSNSALEQGISVSRSKNLESKHHSVEINNSVPLPTPDGTKDKSEVTDVPPKTRTEDKSLVQENKVNQLKKDTDEIKVKKVVDIQENRNQVFEDAATVSKEDSKSKNSPKVDNKHEHLTEAECSKKSLKRKLEDESGAGTSGTSTGTSDNDADDKDPSKDKKKKNRCAVCRKKVGLTGFECRCGGLFCAVHRYSDKHECSFDYRELGAQEIRRNNPVVVSQKIHKI